MKARENKTAVRKGENIYKARPNFEFEHEKVETWMVESVSVQKDVVIATVGRENPIDHKNEHRRVAFWNERWYNEQNIDISREWCTSRERAENMADSEKSDLRPNELGYRTRALFIELKRQRLC